MSSADEEYDGYEEYAGPLTPHQQRARVWSAHSLGVLDKFGREDVDEAALMDALGETEPTTGANEAWRVRLLVAYRGGVEQRKRL